jgi:hypothetical protein
MKLSDLTSEEELLTYLYFNEMLTETNQLFALTREIGLKMYSIEENTDGTIYLQITDEKRINEEDYKPVALMMYISKNPLKYMDGSERRMVGFRMRSELDPQPVTSEMLMQMFTGELYVKVVFGQFNNAVTKYCVAKERQILGRSMAAVKIADLTKGRL